MDHWAHSAVAGNVGSLRGLGPRGAATPARPCASGSRRHRRQHASQRPNPASSPHRPPRLRKPDAPPRAAPPVRATRTRSGEVCRPPGMTSARLCMVQRLVFCPLETSSLNQAETKQVLSLTAIFVSTEPRGRKADAWNRSDLSTPAIPLSGEGRPMAAGSDPLRWRGLGCRHAWSRTHSP